MKSKLILLLLVVSLLATVPVRAEEQKCSNHSMHKRIPLNKVVYHLSVEQWVVSDKANVTVSIDANLQQQAVDQLQTQVMSNLQKLSNAEWRITYYSRHQDQSDLERVNMQAEARVSQAALNDIRGKASTLSKPGIKYTIANIDYAPSTADIEHVRQELRQAVYTQTQAELDRMNKIYANGDFSIHHVDFFYGDVNPRQVMMKRGASQEMMMTAMAAPVPASMAVSQKEKLTAMVTFASKMR
jgi:hypothetical protein